MTSISISEGWEGRTVNGVFPLLEWLGGSASRGVFLTVRQGAQTACIKLIVATGPEADAYLSQWQVGRAMSHPDLAQVMESGRCTIDGREMVFVVTERAESVLSGIVPRKALDPNKVRRFLDPVLNALMDLNEKGLVHGHLKPSNILRVGDQWKLSGDGLVIAGESPKVAREQEVYDAPETAEGRFTPASDVWSLGMIIAEALTQRLPASDSGTTEDPVVAESLERPFSEIVRACLRVRPEERCSIVQMKALLSLVKSPAEPLVAAAEPVAIVTAASVADEVVVAKVAEPSAAVAEEAPARAEPAAAEVAPIDVATETIPEDAKPAAVEATSVAEVGTVAKDPEPVAVEAKVVEQPAETKTEAVVAAAKPDLADVLPYAKEEAKAAEEERSPEPRPSRWEMELEGEAVADAIGVSPRSRLFASAEEEEEGKKTRVWPAVLGIVLLLAMAAGYVTRAEWIGYVMPIVMRVAEAVRKPAAQTQTSPSPAGSQSQSQSLPGANAAAPSPETQPNPTGEGQSASPPVQAGQESQKNAAAGQAEGPPQSSAASAVKPQREPAEARAGQKDKDEAQKLREENQDGAVLKKVMPNVSPQATNGMRRPLEVELRVSVDEDGNVSGAEYRSLGPGNYFARIARQAVLKWKFQPPVKSGQAKASVWTVRFHFGREETDVSAVEVH